MARACEQDLYRYALWQVRAASTAEELVQDAFLRAWRSRNTPRTLGDFRPWVFRITANLCRSHVRRVRLQESLRFWAPPQPDPLEEFERCEGDTELAAALRSLRHRERVAVYLYYYEDRPHAEVAHVLGLSEGASRVLVHRALGKLRAILGGDSLREVRS